MGQRTYVTIEPLGLYMLRTHGTTFNLAVMPDADNDMLSSSVIGEAVSRRLHVAARPRRRGGWHPGMHGPGFESAVRISAARGLGLAGTSQNLESSPATWPSMPVGMYKMGLPLPRC